MPDTRENPVENLTEAKLKKILLNFERKFQDNQKLRIKHADEPSKFAGSETELFAALDELQNIACQPEFYHLMVSKKSLSTLVSLLTHENTDISAKVVGMLQEFTDIDEPDEQEPVELLIKSLRAENIMDHLVSNLSRLDEKNPDEAQAINNSLSMMDNLIDLNSEFATLNSEALIKWILDTLKRSNEFNSVKLSVAELLSVLLLNSSENKQHLARANGINVLLQQVAYYRRVAPITGDEHEFLEQVINCLCTAILDCDENRELFLEEEGIDLVELLLRERGPVVQKSNLKLSILKLLNHVLTTDKSHDQVVSRCCERFIQALGLRVLFPALNKPKLVLSQRIKKRQLQQAMDEVEEHTCAILLALLKYCQDQTLIQRVLIKIAESNFEKLNRLVELHDKYFGLVLNQHQVAEQSQDEDDDDDDVGTSGARFTLRTVDYIILLTTYLAHHFETYDPSSGETFKNHINQLTSRRPELKHQIVYEMRRHLEGGVAEASPEEEGSLKLLLAHFELPSS